MTGREALFSILFIKLCFVSVGAEQDIRHPVRGSAHLFADGFQIYTRITFDDQFIVDVSDDKAVPKGFHNVLFSGH